MPESLRIKNDIFGSIYENLKRYCFVKMMKNSFQYLLHKRRRAFEESPKNS